MKYDIIIDPPAEEHILSAVTWYENSQRGLGHEYVETMDAV